ncbi:hypothetical protein K9N68_01525 [Kovacikia minuta CCNUW1]|uniref:hypothetical protein n=1 Tax=Kovacikia minuta TaxID=2931930 RepID=UPI001CCB8E6B|nr:hypothetical protein [Kovacikia minuta]UBF26711.1 hypothetical protein K9N68_01525 [Kovacikia minuta CCNUW1]
MRTIHNRRVDNSRAIAVSLADSAPDQQQSLWMQIFLTVSIGSVLLAALAVN